MQVKITARHGHLSETSQEKIRGKVEGLPRLFERLTAIEVTVDLEHQGDPIVDLRVSAEHKHDFHASEQNGDLWGSLDAVIHKVEQQLRKYKQKVQDHHKGPGLKRPGAAAEPEVSGE